MKIFFVFQQHWRVFNLKSANLEIRDQDFEGRKCQSMWLLRYERHLGEEGRKDKEATGGKNDSHIGSWLRAEWWENERARDVQMKITCPSPHGKRRSEQAIMPNLTTTTEEKSERDAGCIFWDWYLRRRRRRFGSERVHVFFIFTMNICIHMRQIIQIQVWKSESFKMAEMLKLRQMNL